MQDRHARLDDVERRRTVRQRHGAPRTRAPAQPRVPRLDPHVAVAPRQRAAVEIAVELHALDQAKVPAVRGIAMPARRRGADEDVAAHEPLVAERDRALHAAAHVAYDRVPRAVLRIVRAPVTGEFDGRLLVLARPRGLPAAQASGGREFAAQAHHHRIGRRCRLARDQLVEEHAHVGAIPRLRVQERRAEAVAGRQFLDHAVDRRLDRDFLECVVCGARGGDGEQQRRQGRESDVHAIHDAARYAMHWASENRMRAGGPRCADRAPGATCRRATA